MSYLAEFHYRPHGNRNWNWAATGALVTIAIILSSLTTYGLLSEKYARCSIRIILL